MTKAIAPMLASPMSKADIGDWNNWMMEEKYDGHRLVVTIDNLGHVIAHTRERRHAGNGGGKDQLTRTLPPHLVREFARMAPRGLTLTLDGELVVVLANGKLGTSTDVTRLDFQDSLHFVAFDVLMTEQGSCMMLPYEQRRSILELLFATYGQQHVVLAGVRECVDSNTVAAFCDEVWDRGGEGLILKRKAARYHAGKRSTDFIKIKKLFTTVGRVVGFEATRGTVMNRGPFACVVLELEDGKRTSVKTKDDAELERFVREWSPIAANIEGTLDHVQRCINRMHPALGRKLRIEYQDIAADGGLRHPRWDRWEDE